MKISVIIPVFNEEKYIGICLKSLLTQTRPADEIIVVDDGSTDTSKEQIKKFKVKLFNQTHKGPAKARNLRVRKTIGDILIFPDADMKFDKNYIENLIKPIEAGKAFATFIKEEYVANPKNIWSWCWSINSYLPPNLHIDPNIPEKTNNFRAILKETFLKTKGYKNVGYGEDVTVLYQLKGAKAKLAKGAICYHFNPSTLPEVFISARWMGKGETINRNLKSFFTYSLPNSLRRGILESARHKKPAFLLFKMVFDFAVLLGMIERMLGKRHEK